MPNSKAVAVVLLLLGVQTAVANLLNLCVSEPDGKRMPLITDCAKFVVCQKREITMIRSCPRGLFFNPELEECDFQWRVDCTGLLTFNSQNDDACVCDCCADQCGASETTTPCDTDGTTPPSMVPETDPPITTEPNPGDTTLTTDKETTNKQTTATSTTIKSTTAKSTTVKPASTPSSSGTTNGVQPTASNGCPNQLTDCINHETGETLPIAGECGKWITCNAGCAIVLECPSGLYYDFESSSCDYWWNVECTQAAIDDGSGTIAGPSGTTCSEQGPCAGQRDGVLLANPNTNGYYVCQCQCPIAMPCDANTKFNETAQVCDWDRTGSGSGSGSGNSAVICPEDLVYNATSNQCDYPAGYVPKVVCDNTETMCNGQPEGTLYPMEGVCNKFYKCNYNCAVEQICPNNLVYDTTQQLCNYPQNVKCAWPYTPPSGPTAGPSGISCESNGRCLGQREGTLLPSKTSCNGYTVCQCECEVEMRCADGLYWDAAELTCNYASKVECTL